MLSAVAPIAQKAPKVIEETTNIARGNAVEGFLKKMIFPTAVGAGVAGGVGYGISKLGGR